MAEEKDWNWEDPITTTDAPINTDKISPGVAPVSPAADPPGTEETAEAGFGEWLDDLGEGGETEVLSPSGGTTAVEEGQEVKPSVEDEGEGEGEEVKQTGEEDSPEPVDVQAEILKGLYKDLQPGMGLPDLTDEEQLDAFVLVQKIIDSGTNQVENMITDWKTKISETDTIGAAMLNFLAKGGHSDDFFDIMELTRETVEPKTEFEYIQLLKADLKASDYTDDEITDTIDTMRDAGTLEKRGKALFKKRAEEAKIKIEALTQESISAIEKRKQGQRAIVENVKERLRKEDPVRGLDIPAAEKASLMQFMFSPTVNVAGRMVSPMIQMLSPQYGGDIDDMVAVARILQTKFEAVKKEDLTAVVQDRKSALAEKIQSQVQSGKHSKGKGRPVVKPVWEHF